MNRRFSWVLTASMGAIMAQVVSFYIASLYCKFIAKNQGSTCALVLSDIHLLGHRRRNVLERMWSDWQIFISVTTALHVHRPALLVVLGDQLDEGGFPTQQLVYESYVRRFSWIFSQVRRKTLFVMGNHDMHFGAEELMRYENAFGACNSMYLAGGASFVVLNTIALDTNVHSGNNAKIQTQRFLNDLRRELERKNTNHKVILLTHFPLYRVNDLNCGDLRSNERGHITYLDPASRYQKHRHVLSPPLSKYLLDTIRPSLVLSGHTHAYCAQHHRVESMNGFPMNISEYTIPSFAWSQRPDPSYAVLNLDFSISPELQLCHLPDERFIATICLLFISVCLLKYVKTLGPISSNKNRIAQSHFRTTQSVHKVSESELRTENVL
ncbi:hypothetical protein ABG067_006252 [Albugo candida]